MEHQNERTNDEQRSGYFGRVVQSYHIPVYEGQKERIKNKEDSKRYKDKEGTESIHTFMRTPKQSIFAPSIKASCGTALFDTDDGFRDG